MNQSSIRVVVLALLIGVALTLLYKSCFAARRPPQVSEGERWLHVVRLDIFTIKQKDDSEIICREYELRLTGIAREKALLIRGRDIVREAEFSKDANGQIFVSRPIQYQYSDNIYSVNLDGSFTAGKIGKSAWDKARPVANNDMRPGYNSDGTRRLYGNESRQAAAGGSDTESVHDAPVSSAVGGAELRHELLSQSGHYIASFSHTSRRRLFKRPSLFPLLGGDDGIANGTMYVDLFDGKTKRRLAQASQGHNGSLDMSVFEEATWVEDRYFVMPLEVLPRNWLIGVMPE